VSALTDVFATWESATWPRVDVHRIAWPELEEVLRAASGLRPFVQMSSAAVQFVGSTVGARRILTTTPLAPRHMLVGLDEILAKITGFLRDHPAHSICEPLQLLAGALDAIRDSESPFAEWFGNVLSEYSEDARGRPEAVVVVPRQAWVPAVGEWMSAEELSCVDVASPAQLRTVGGYRAVLLAGHPATAFSSVWKDPETVLRESGWLLTAPPAAHVRMALPADAPAIKPYAAWLLPDGAHPPLKVNESGPHRAQPALHDWGAPDHGVPTVPRLAIIGNAEVEETHAVAILTATGYSVFFHSQLGPRPHVVVVDDETGGVALTVVKPSALRAGLLLAVRVGVAPHEQVVTRANSWLKQRRRWSDDDIQQTREAAFALKGALRTARVLVGVEELHRRLVGRGVESGYAHVLLHNPLDEHYIVPQRLAAFDALTTVIGAPELAAQFDALANVRVAHQQAGEDIRREVVDLLRARPWVDRVDEDGWVALQANGLGTLLLTIVTGRSEKQLAVPRTWLGVPIDRSGRRVFAIDADEEPQ